MPRLLALAAALVVFMVVPAAAGACSCVGGDPRDRLSEAEAAFVGMVTAEREDGGRRTYRLTVEEAVKGELPATIEVGSDGRSSCGIDLEPGQRVGLLLHRGAPPYEVGSCDLIEPQELQAATRPYPRGAGSGTARLLVAGAFHDAGLAALDARGRLLGWAFGSEGDAIGVCPGARYAVQAGDDVSVIRLRDLAVVSRRALPDQATGAVRCLDRTGDRLAAATFRYGGSSERRRLVILDRRRVRDLGVRASRSVALGSRASYVAVVRSGSSAVLAVNHATGRTRRLLSRGGSIDALALSPDQRRLAFTVAPPRGRPARLGLIATTGGPVRTRVLGRLRAPLWLSANRLAVSGERRAGYSFDSRLRTRGAVASWSTDVAVSVGRRVWWLEFTVGLRGRVLGAPRSPRVTVDHLGAGRGLAAISGGARVVADRRAPSASGAATAATTTRCGRESSQ